MDEPDTKQSDPRWYNRGIGVFCGGFLGFFGSGLLALVLGDLPTVQILLLLAFGLVTGITTGYLFPRVTESVWWILSIFS